MQMQGGYIMLEKFLGIFKRDKTVFSKSELIFQKKIAKRIRFFVIIVLVVGGIVCANISSDTILVLILLRFK